MAKRINIRVPASTANIGPGFDTLGIALSLYLELKVTLPSDSLKITIEGHGATELPSDPSDNLIIATAARVAKHYGKSLPAMHVHCINGIPLGSGLGSSGSAVVAGVVLANASCDLKLPIGKLLDFCLVEEGHPDNVAPSLLGGFIAAYMNENFEELDVAQQSIGSFVRLNCSKEIKAVAVTPAFQLPTHLARKALPSEYSKKDVIFNLQRATVLSNALGSVSHRTYEEDIGIIYEAMKDTIHQRYRQHLVPGLVDILKELTPSNHPGLLGVCLSGAGPTVLALAVFNFDQIGTAIKDSFFKARSSNPIESTVRFLDVDYKGTVCTIENV